MFQLKITLFDDDKPMPYGFSIRIKEKFVAIAAFEKISELFDKVE